MQQLTKEFPRNHFEQLMRLHKPLIKELSLLLMMMLQYEELCFSKNQVHPQENLFQAIIEHIKENQHHLYQTFALIDHLLVQM